MTCFIMIILKILMNSVSLENTKKNINRESI